MASTTRSAGPTVVLAGRPNVGKSTLFNRIAGTRRAIVTPVAGTTRDVLSQHAVWGDRRFELVDTGGMFGASTDPLQAAVVEHGHRAIGRADVIVFVVDGRDGLVSADRDVASAVRRTGASVVLAVNKMDDRRARDRALEFYQFGFDTVMEISAEHNQGIAELLDAVVAGLPRTADAADLEERATETSVAIVGRPNVGKSSLVNRLVRDQRVMVSDVPGTTRDAIDTLMRWREREFRIIDTAGLRRPGRIATGGQVEEVSAMVARRAIAGADVAVVMVDAVEGVTDQDASIAGEASRSGCGVIIAVNKWDLRKGQGTDAVAAFDDEARRRLPFLEHAPLLHISALTGDRVPRLLETVDRIANARRQRVSTAALNRFLETVTAAHPPASPGRRAVRILYGAQTGVAPPTFVLFTNVATTLHFSYERFLVNRLREAFGFEGTPIRIEIRRRGSERGADGGRAASGPAPSPGTQRRRRTGRPEQRRTASAGKTTTGKTTREKAAVGGSSARKAVKVRKAKTAKKR